MEDIRFLAEWEACEAILLTLPAPFTDWNYILPETCEQYRLLLRAFTAEGYRCIVVAPSRDYARQAVGEELASKIEIFETPYNDTWIRDYGPLAVIKSGRERLLDFGFNGWGLKFAADKDNLVNSSGLVPEPFYRKELDFELEGGSVDTDGRGTILTTSRCLCSPNRNGGKSKTEINAILERRLGAQHVLWLDYGYLAGDDTDSHIDTLCRMAPDNTILFTGCRDMDDEHFEELLKMRAQLTMMRTPEGDPYNLVELPLPDPIFDEEGSRLPASYANYLVTPRHVFMPVYNQPQKDMMACQTVRIAFPDHKVVPVDCRVLIRQHGSLHCATMQIPFSIPQIKE